MPGCVCSPGADTPSIPLHPDLLRSLPDLRHAALPLRHSIGSVGSVTRVHCAVKGACPLCHRSAALSPDQVRVVGGASAAGRTPRTYSPCPSHGTPTMPLRGHVSVHATLSPPRSIAYPGCQELSSSSTAANYPSPLQRSAPVSEDFVRGRSHIRGSSLTPPQRHRFPQILRP